jgi:hypothetical protein
MKELKERQTVEKVIAWLQQFPSDSIVYAYEGEVTAIVVTAADESRGFGEQLGYLETRE